MPREVTITISEEVYRGLEAVAGNRTISQLIEDLTRPLVEQAGLDAAYRQMGEDAAREREAFEWSEAMIPDASPSGQNNRP